MTARIKRFEIERQLIGAVNNSVRVTHPLEGLTAQAVDFWIRRNELQLPEHQSVRNAVVELSRRLGTVFGESGQEIVTKVDQLEADLADVISEFSSQVLQQPSRAQ